jgi:tetratricopeptide (TPR) repeat protein
MKSLQMSKQTAVTNPKRKRGQDSSPRLRFGMVGLLLILPATVQAQNELNAPYDLHIVVHVAENRLLTDVFRKNIERELRDGFQSALGEMGHVTVTDKHPRLEDVLKRGLRSSLDEWKDRTDRKTHFVLIDYTGAQYEIQARQYDGSIGQASPVVRFDRTRDRAFVAKAAALLIKQDFGVLGTVRTGPEGAKEEVKIELRGGALGDMTRWVKKDDVFALAPPEGGTQAVLKFSLLQVEQAPAEDARNGVCVCRFFHRYKVPSIVDYRCIKLGTVQTPLRIRWTQRMPNGRIKPLDQLLTVDIRRYGFDGDETTKLQLVSNLNGVLETVGVKDGVFNNVAFVRVVDGLAPPLPQVPISLVDDQPVIIEVNASTSIDSLFTIHESEWKSRVADSVQMQADLFKRLERLGSKAENRAEIIAAATSGMNRAKTDRESLLKQREDLEKEAKSSGKVLKISIEDRRLKQLEDYEQALVKFIEEQRKIDVAENDPQRKKWLSDIESAKLLLKRLEYGEAIKVYERIQREGYKDDKLDAYVEQLHKRWDPQGHAHVDARGFIYGVWPTLDLSRLEEGIPKAQEAFKTCKNVRDSIGIQKLLRGTLEHADRLEKKLAELHPELVIDDEKEARELKKVSEQILKLGLEIQDYVNAHPDDK